MKKIRQYDGLYGDLEYRHRPGYVFLEMIETRSKRFDWVVLPHIHAHLLQVFFVVSGHVTFQATDSVRHMKSPCILIVPPATLHGLVYSEDVTGRILTMSDDVLESLLPEAESISGILQSLQIINVSKHAAKDFKAILDLLIQTEHELFSNLAGKDLMLKAHLINLYVLIYRLFELQELVKKSDDDPKALKYFRAFQKNVSKSEFPKSIPRFAEELHISTVHLNRVCRSVTGKAASLIIQEYLVKQAQNYLNHTSYSISEIAYLLKFEYPNYFARFFRKHTGISPKEYRRKYR